MGLAEIAKRLDASPNMVNQLVRSGLLVPVHAVRRGRGTKVTVENVETFANAYAFSNELGRLAGRQQRHGTGPTVTRRLLKNGIRPVCAPPEFCGYMFEREEAVALMARLGMVKSATVG